MRRAVVLSFRAAGHVPAVMVGQLLLKEWEMPPARNCATLIALVLWMAACVVAAVSWPIASRAAAERDGVVDHTPVSSALAAKGGQTSKEARNRARNQARNQAEAQARNQAETEAGTLGGTLAGTLGETQAENHANNHERNHADDAPALSGARALLAAGYERAPALMIALCAFVVLPVLALSSLLVQAMAARRRRQAAIRATERRAGEAEPDGETPPEMPLWSEEAWLTVDGPEDGPEEGPGPRTLPRGGRRIRIGRHGDNDVRLPDAIVDRRHGVIKLDRTCLTFESPSP